MKVLINEHLQRANQIATAIDHKKRQQILNWLHDHPKSSVTDIRTAMKMGESECSGHLAMLRKISMLTNEKNGKRIFYSLDMEYVASLNDLLKRLSNLVKAE